MIAVQNQDYGAYDELFTAHHTKLIWWLKKAFRLTLEEAQDIAGNTHAHILKNPGRFDPRRGTFKAWLYAVAIGQVKDARRKQRCRPENPMESDVEYEDPNGSGFHDMVDYWFDFRAIIENLKGKEERSALKKVLRAAFEGREIFVLEKPSAKFFVDLCRGRRNLREEVRKWLERGSGGGPKPTGGASVGSSPKRVLRQMKENKKVEAARQLLGPKVMKALRLERRDTDDLQLMLELLDLHNRSVRPPPWGRIISVLAQIGAKCRTHRHGLAATVLSLTVMILTLRFVPHVFEQQYVKRDRVNKQYTLIRTSGESQEPLILSAEWTVPKLTAAVCRPIPETEITTNGQWQVGCVKKELKEPQLILYKALHTIKIEGVLPIDTSVEEVRENRPGARSW